MLLYLTTLPAVLQEEITQLDLDALKYCAHIIFVSCIRNTGL